MICDKIIADINCNTIVQNEPYDSNFAYIYILQLNKHDGNTISQTFIRTNIDLQIAFSMGYDGYYTLCKLVIPVDETQPYYYRDSRIYKNTGEESTVQEVLEVNPEVSGIEITYYQYFQLCKLRKCYINLANKVLNSQASIDCRKDSEKISKDDIYKRDLVWSAMNVITYLAEMGLFEEAERLLERITGCNGLCDNDNKKQGCGCSK